MERYFHVFVVFLYFLISGFSPFLPSDRPRGPMSAPGRLEAVLWQIVDRPGSMSLAYKVGGEETLIAIATAVPLLCCRFSWFFPA